METADRNNSRVILANDPDADRLAIAEKQEKSVKNNCFNYNCTVYNINVVFISFFT